MLFPQKVCVAEEKPLLSKQNATPTHPKRSESVCRRQNIRPPSAIDQALRTAIPKGRPERLTIAPGIWLSIACLSVVFKIRQLQRTVEA